MSVDLSQFHQVFFEESVEGLDIMEAGLLDLQPGSEDLESINSIFRAAHSIKGGAGTFGFPSLADFTHVLETLLDELREGKREVTKEAIDLFLQAVDCLREMIVALQQGQETDAERANELKVAFELMLNEDGSEGDSAAASETAASDDAPAQTAEIKVQTWTIYFKPENDVLRTGNEPLRMFRELTDLGDITVEAIEKDLPAFASLHPEECYLAWNIQLTGDATKEQIEEVFEWVVDDSELTIEPADADATPVPDKKDDKTADSAAEKVPEQVTNASVDDEIKTDAVAASNVEAIAPVASSSVASTSAPKKDAVATTKQAKSSGLGGEATSIRVSIDKVDTLINMVGELVITQSMLGELGTEFDMSRIEKLQQGLQQLELNTRELQENVMRIRMLPISFNFNRFPRLVRDMCQKLDKKIELKLTGEETELDKTVMEKIGDPMVHLVRNALDHGIEMPEDRIAAGKPETGTLTLNAFHQGGNIVIEIIDDGGGLNCEKILSKARAKGLVGENEDLTQEQIQNLIFQPGFSTADVVSDVSGRGVGMDVVRRNIEALKGSVEVESVEGQGSKFSIHLPLTLAILDGQLISVGVETYILPLVSIVESIQMEAAKVNAVAGGCTVYRLREEYIPIIRLHELFEIDTEHKELDKGLLVIVEGGGEKVGLLVDELMAQQQVVIKSLESNFQKVEGVSGATILGDGTVALILDITGMVKMAGIKQSELNIITAMSDHEAA